MCFHRVPTLEKRCLQNLIGEKCLYFIVYWCWIRPFHIDDSNRQILQPRNPVSWSSICPSIFYQGTLFYDFTGVIQPFQLHNQFVSVKNEFPRASNNEWLSPGKGHHLPKWHSHLKTYPNFFQNVCASLYKCKIFMCYVPSQSDTHYEILIIGTCWDVQA